jgi:uncharacterized membrane protein
MKTFSALFTFIALALWSLSPMSQHAHDRTWAYWVMWAIMECVLLFGFVKAWLKLGEE